MLQFAYPFQTEETVKPLLCAKGEATEVVSALSKMGYDAVELLIRNPAEAELDAVTALITASSMEVASFGTGPMVADDQLSFSALDDRVRMEAINRTIQLINWAHEVGASVSIGKLRGQMNERHPNQSWDFMRDSFLKVLEVADKKKVPLLIEPQNRMHMNNLNDTHETLSFIEEFASSSLGIMLDNLHMEAEPIKLSAARLIKDAQKKLGFFHLTDSERRIPGEGIFDIQGILKTLSHLPHPPVVSFEIKQQNDQFMTAKRAITYVKSLMKN
ncbi:sugar phosphate isomerase/epimerase [Alkalihalobacillus clausii]|uniref:sugar phosphate isomerase/epimerase family protein n=1 Tax=Shouchella clausii TaxID=79880 RepID=UPI00203BD3BA|nr:sugar phosphate isomerase/epimerase family protein [Shouchella clausii]MCM3550780.1 sugar phosphate isomerase/epimerase [Shouchella clausii]